MSCHVAILVGIFERTIFPNLVVLIVNELKLFVL